MHVLLRGFPCTACADLTGLGTCTELATGGHVLIRRICLLPVPAEQPGHRAAQHSHAASALSHTHPREHHERHGKYRHQDDRGPPLTESILERSTHGGTQPPSGTRQPGRRCAERWRATSELGQPVHTSKGQHEPQPHAGKLVLRRFAPRPPCKDHDPRRREGGRQNEPAEPEE